jgi:hypothetical protein
MQYFMTARCAEFAVRRCYRPRRDAMMRALPKLGALAGMIGGRPDTKNRVQAKVYPRVSGLLPLSHMH